MGNGETRSCSADPSLKPPAPWSGQPAAEAVGVGPSGIVCLGAGVCVQFKKIFGHFYLHFWLVWVLALAVPHLNVVHWWCSLLQGGVGCNHE